MSDPVLFVVILVLVPGDKLLKPFDRHTGTHRHTAQSFALPTRNTPNPKTVLVFLGYQWSRISDDNDDDDDLLATARSNHGQTSFAFGECQPPTRKAEFAGGFVFY